MRQVPSAPPVLLRLTASIPKAGALVQFVEGNGGAGHRRPVRLEAMLIGAAFSLAEDAEVCYAC